VEANTKAAGAARPSRRTAESLGKPTYEQRPSAANLGAGAILSALLVAAGLALLWMAIRDIRKAGGQLPLAAERGMSWLSAALLVIIGVGLAAGGVLLFRWVWEMLSFRLYVCPDGFYYTKKRETGVFAWDEIQLVEETVLHERLPLVKGPAKHLMPTKTSRSYRVVRCDGTEFSFDGNTIRRVSLLAGPLATAASKHAFPWQVSEEKG
jgi:hypothetical protein